MRPGEFHGRLPGLEVTDPDYWPEKWDGAPGTYSHRKQPGERGARSGPYRQEYAFPARVTLTKVEKEWLGVTVRRSDGIVGQVWTLAASSPGKPQGLWVAGGGVLWLTTVTDVAKVSDSVDTSSLVQ